MGRVVDKPHVHLLYGISICVPYPSHESINKKQIRVESSMSCSVRYMRITANNSSSVFMRTDRWGGGSKILLLNNYLLCQNVSIDDKHHE